MGPPALPPRCSHANAPAATTSDPPCTMRCTPLRRLCAASAAPLHYLTLPFTPPDRHVGRLHVAREQILQAGRGDRVDLDGDPIGRPLRPRLWH
eukprot:scaffold96538_cov63-Phaeocystis_antarctica.AAC.1